jgi:hypothetical protein
VLSDGARINFRPGEEGEDDRAESCEEIDPIAKSGLCFPSYERIAEAAGCARSTVAEALKALEDAGILSWVHRVKRVREPVPDLLGNNGWRWRVLRTSNSYAFNDPSPAFGGMAGDYIPKPKWTRRSTYDRKLEEIFAAEEVVDDYLCAALDKLKRRLGRPLTLA